MPHAKDAEERKGRHELHEAINHSWMGTAELQEPPKEFKAPKEQNSATILTEKLRDRKMG
jgi:hypothetical protein